MFSHISWGEYYFILSINCEYLPTCVFYIVFILEDLSYFNVKMKLWFLFSWEANWGRGLLIERFICALTHDVSITNNLLSLLILGFPNTSIRGYHKTSKLLSVEQKGVSNTVYAWKNIQWVIFSHDKFNKFIKLHKDCKHDENFN